MRDKAPILVTGAHRTGTTWVGKMLTASGQAAYISEPLNVLHRPGVLRVPTSHWYTYICNDNEQAYLQPIQEMLGFRYHGLAEIKSSVGEIIMVKVTMYCTEVCPYCVRAEQLLKKRGVTEIEKIRIDLLPEQRDIMVAKTGRRTVPQIYIGEHHVGGFDDMAELDSQGGLVPLLQG